MMGFKMNETMKPIFDTAAMLIDFSNKWNQVMPDLADVVAPKVGTKFDMGEFKLETMFAQTQEWLEAMIQSVPVSDKVKQDLKDQWQRVADAFEILYDKSMNVSTELTKEGILIQQAWIKGEKGASKRLHDKLTAAIEDINSYIDQILQQAPASSVRKLNAIGKQVLEILTKEEGQVNGTILGLMALAENLMQACQGMEACRIEEDPPPMLLAAAGFALTSFVLEAIEKAQKQVVASPSVPEPVKGKYMEMNDNLLALTRKQMEFVKAGIQIPASCFWALMDADAGQKGFVTDLFSDDTTIDFGEFFKRWADGMDRYWLAIIEKSGIETTVPKWYQLYLDVVHEMQEQVACAMTLPYVTRQDLEEFEEKMDSAIASKIKSEDKTGE